ncbi:NEL-type E3 ubiquitin ligase domain-containing protein [Pseudomonas sp. HS6]|uniref:NEL-type E3 ubiquitin ligase domain-containing protein n=1 Tax=Pseudomonas sp. HS6 TaxID=2850559 RepID=UPI0020189AC5|nr:NEL-type E3 ubiquitin ligase domain-containing protein [Pseudomonas sp. HS6]UQS16069.1 hypothetical protein JJN09_04175 [Pseudomonas sp. HS6]
MDVETSRFTPPEMTPAQQGVFFDLVKKQLPGWLLQSTAEVRAVLYKSLIASYRSREAALAGLRTFQSPEAFSSPLLEKAMSDQLGEPLQVQGVIFQHIRSTSSLFGLRQKLILPIARDLLAAACENFEFHETFPGNYHERALIYVPEQVTGSANKVLAIKPHEFAALCRRLDLGKQYQVHVSSLFGVGTRKGSLQDSYLAYLKDRFEVDLHIAFLKKHVSADVYSILKVKSEKTSFQRLEVFSAKLNGPVMIWPFGQASNDERCVVYLPGDPFSPLMQYATFSDFELQLSNRLHTTEYREGFLHFIGLGERVDFLKALDTRSLHRKASHFPSVTSYISITRFDLKEDMFQAMFQQLAAQVRADTRLLVVPTDDEDEKSRLARLETYKTVGLNLFAYALSFVPVVGEVMLAVAGFQLLKEVFDGIDSWLKGEQEQATEYLFDTLENLILMTAMAAAGSGVAGTYRAVTTSDFVQRLRVVPVASGVTRLWKPDISAYRQQPVTPGNRRVDKLGLMSARDSQYLPIGTDIYAVKPMDGTGLWEIQFPETLRRYPPVLETNGAGAWRHDAELPEDWSLMTLFRRLGYLEEEVSDTQALQILAASNIEEQALRQLYLDRSKPMATLTDTARRFRVDADVGNFIEKLYTPESAAGTDPDLQLYLLTSMDRWPRDVGVVVTSITGREVSSYGEAAAVRKVRLTQQQLEQQAFYPVLLDALNSQERSTLLNSASIDPAVQASLLSMSMANHAEQNRLHLFERLYRRVDALTQEAATPLRETFADLPASVIDELAENADAGEWQELEAGRVPLRLAEEARRYGQVIRLNRAFEGLYLDAASGTDTDLLVLDTLAQLPGWPQDVSIKIVDWAVYSEHKPAIGPDDAPHNIFIDAYTDGYKALDENDRVLSMQSRRTRELFFRTLWESLPLKTRKSLGVEPKDAGAALRQKITDLALQRRDVLAKAIGVEAMRTGYRSPMGLADRIIERSTWLVLPHSRPVLSRSPALRQRARELYPTHSSVQIDRFLMTLASDEVRALRMLESLRQEFQKIRNTLEQWIYRETHYQEGDGPRLKVPARSKARASQAILKAWRRESGFTLGGSQLLYSLKFDAQPLGELPIIVGRFGHVGMLEMDKVGTSAGLNTFLRNFTNLYTLSLGGNHLMRIPPAVADMPRLIRLDLSNNQIQLTARTAEVLNSNVQLQMLNLSFNPQLGRMPSLQGLHRLRHLALRGSGISQWPHEVSELSAMETLDLRDNLIEELPPSVFEASKALNRGISIDGNPLSSSSLQAIANYQASTDINLGVTVVDYQPLTSAPWSLEGLAASWVVGVNAGQTLHRQALWSALWSYPTSRDFFELLAQLRATADFNRLHTVLTRRVWDVLEAAGDDDSLRRSLFRRARLGRISNDDPVHLFNDLEVRVLCQRALVAARTGDRTLEGELIGLLRGLFRLQELDRLASLEAAKRARNGAFSRQQTKELSLLYRARLAQRLGLPAQSEIEALTLNIEVNTEEIERVYQNVLDAEQTDALKASISERVFWSEYLASTYPEAFAPILERNTESMARLEAQVELPRAAASQQMSAILENYRNELQALRNRLTSEALARYPAARA